MITTYVGEPLDVFNIPLDYRNQYKVILADMKTVGVTHNDIYKHCDEYKTPICQRELKRLGKDAEVYELMVMKQTPKAAQISLVDFGWAKLHDSYACDVHVPNKGPGKKKTEDIDDVTVLDKLDRTFQRSLLIEQHFMVDWTGHYTKKQVHEYIKQFPNLIIRKMVTHDAIPQKSDRMSVFGKFYNYEKWPDDFRGQTTFDMYHIYDMEPKYGLRPSSKGERIVNMAMFDFKKVCVIIGVPHHIAGCMYALHLMSLLVTYTFSKVLHNNMGGGFQIHGKYYAYEDDY